MTVLYFTALFFNRPADNTYKLNGWSARRRYCGIITSESTNMEAQGVTNVCRGKKNNNSVQQLLYSQWKQCCCCWTIRTVVSYQSTYCHSITSAPCCLSSTLDLRGSTKTLRKQGASPITPSTAYRHTTHPKMCVISLGLDTSDDAK